MIRRFATVSSRRQGGIQAVRVETWAAAVSSTQSKAVADLAGQIDTAIKSSWQERFLSAAAEADSEIPNRGTCEWLYNNHHKLFGAARVMPCCIGAGQERKALEFFSILMIQVCMPEDHGRLANGVTYARTPFAESGIVCGRCDRC